MAVRRSLPEVPEGDVAPWIDGVEFPARRVDLVAAALRRDAPDWVVERLGRLPEERFDAVDDVCRGRERAARSGGSGGEGGI
ncbi:MAG TPA: DUF2795 domain-containing protein [Acidimicrobiales bacterium]|nr:DUF2795 domain-containing protein [Acidimicrobiales bacterium]